MKHVVIDPSMVLKKDTLDHFEEMAPQLTDFQLYFPDSFFESIEDGDLQAHFEDRISGERGALDGRNLYSFYRVSPQKATSPDRIREFVLESEYKMSTEYVENSNRRPEGLNEIIDSLQRGDAVGSILAEEASFIFSGSRIISRIKNR